MTLVPFNKNEIDDIEVKKPKNEDIIKTLIEFITSEHDCVEVREYAYTNANNCRNAINMTINRLGLLNIKVRMRGLRVFLIKEQ